MGDEMKNKNQKKAFYSSFKKFLLYFLILFLAIAGFLYFLAWSSECNLFSARKCDMRQHPAYHDGIYAPQLNPNPQ